MGALGSRAERTLNTGSRAEQREAQERMEEQAASTVDGCSMHSQRVREASVALQEGVAEERWQWTRRVAEGHLHLRVALVLQEVAGPSSPVPDAHARLQPA